MKNFFRNNFFADPKPNFSWNKKGTKWKEKEDVQEKKTSRTNFSPAWIVNRCRIKRTAVDKDDGGERKVESKFTLSSSCVLSLFNPFWIHPPQLRLGQLCAPPDAAFELRRGEIYTKTWQCSDRMLSNPFLTFPSLSLYFYVLGRRTILDSVISF